MAAPTTLKLVKNRLPSSSENLDLQEADLLEFIDETKVSRNYVDGSGEPEVDANLSWLERGYVADLAAIGILTARLNRYMEDAKIKTGNDGVVYQKYDKNKFIEQQIKQLGRSAEEKAGKLGFGGNILPTGVIKVIPRDESEDDLDE